MEIPGPGSYEGLQNYFKIRKNYGVPVIGRQKRNDIVDSQRKCNYLPFYAEETPGPGTYRA